MLERQSAYDALISGTNIPTASARTSRGSQALARLRLRERLHQANPNFIHDFEQENFDDRFTFEKSGTVPLSTRFDKKHAALDANPEDVIARLDELFQEERLSFLHADEEDSDWKRYQKIAAALHAYELGMNTTVLERIRNGEGPCDKVFEDLLAPLRSEPLLEGTEQSEADILKVLLAWNKRIAEDCNDDPTARQAFVDALVERLKVVDKVMSIVSDDTNSNHDDETGQDGILEPSQRRLLKSIHVYSPETRNFKNQDPFDMLVMMLAHVRQEEFNIANEDDCMYLTFKVLNGQEQLKHRFDHEKQRRSYQNEKEDAAKDDNRDEVRRCTTKWRISSKRMVEGTRQKLMARIRCARNELRKLWIDKLLKLAVLQAAQPHAERDDLLDDYARSWEEILNKCTQADDYDTLNDKLGKYFLDLEATFEATAKNTRDLKTTQNMVLSRTVKFAGADLRGLDEAERERRIEARMNDPVTARMMEETLEGVSNTRLVATQMLEHLKTMEESMGALLEAATAKHNDLTELTYLINRDERLNYSSEIEVERCFYAERSEDEEDE